MEGGLILNDIGESFKRTQETIIVLVIIYIRNFTHDYCSISLFSVKRMVHMGFQTNGLSGGEYDFFSRPAVYPDRI